MSQAAITEQTDWRAAPEHVRLNPRMTDRCQGETLVWDHVPEPGASF